MKNKTLTRIFTVSLAALMLLLSLAGCADTPAETKDTEAAENTQAAAVSEEATQAEETTESLYDSNGYLKDQITDDIQFNGATLTMLYWSDVENTEFFVEDTTGELVNDSIYTRNLRVEDRLQVKFEYVGTPGNYNNNDKFVTAAKTAKAAGTAYDLYAAYSMTTATCAYNGLCRDISQYSVINLENPWWPDGLISEAKICGKLYFASGDLSTNMLYMMYPLYFNKDLIADFKLDNPYDLVKNNEWTFDKMFEMCAAANANGSATGGDGIYGYVATSTVHADAWFYAAGLRTVDKADDGSLVISELWGSEKADDVATKVQAFFHESYNNYSDSNKTFLNGKAIFNLDRARYASKYLTDASFEYGVVPLPKYNSDQEKFSTCLGFPCTFYAITDTSTQPEAAAAALECLASEGYRNITPALFEITMKAKYVSDNDAAQMFDIIKSTVSFDVGRVYNTQLNNLPYSIFRSFVTGAAVGASYTASFTANTKQLKRTLDKMQSTFAALDN